ncbi:MAG: hypothetical protein AAFV85_28395, partial [Cyanobacteria bacterium J06634_6]
VSVPPAEEVLPRLEDSEFVDDPRYVPDHDFDRSMDEDAEGAKEDSSVPFFGEDPTDHTPDVGTLRRLHDYVARRWPHYYQPVSEERVVSEIDEVLGLEPKFNQPPISFCSSLRRSEQVMERIVADRKTARKVPFNLFVSSFSKKSSRRFYATGPPPSFKAQASFETLAEPVRRK